MSDKWKVSMFNCFDPYPLFLFSCICPCIVQGVSVWELESKGGCGECLVGCYCLSIGLALNREKIRSVYKIKGNCIADCLLICCCFYPCMVTQEYIHVTNFKSLLVHKKDDFGINS